MIDIDLHLHTYYSDGTESPTELVRRAAAEGLRTIAVTDHDGIDGVPEAAAAARPLGICVIPGLEFSAEWMYRDDSDRPEMHTMHILGYGIDLASGTLQEKMKEIRQKRAIRNEKLYRAFKGKGIEIDRKELESASPGGFVGKRSFATAFLKKGLADNLEEVFSSEALMDDPVIRSIHKEKTSAEEAIRIIHQARGKAFLAHPFQLGYPSLSREPEGFRSRLALVIRQLGILGLDGIECYYPTHDRERTAYLLTLADRENLLVSIGSDDHGPCARKIKRIHSFRVEADLLRLAWVKDMTCSDV
ncbi:MAG TPA: PHP domain-containing protein [Bacillota bacterium]|nr:PHP domain-containing protein [Bacillota bacterium]